MDAVISLTNEELLAECASAAEFPIHDPEGNKALLLEARRRSFEGRLEPRLLQMVEAALVPRMALRIADFALSPPNPEFEAAYRLLRSAAGAVTRKYLFHGTLKSRLIGIQREGLMPARRAKSWGRDEYTANAARGVFFTIDWRRAASWIAAAGDKPDVTGARGAVIRLPAAGLPTEEDRFAVSGGSVVVRLPVVRTEEAQVLLPPFSATRPWVSLIEAIEIIRREKSALRKRCVSGVL